jgi:hypothetical protein
MLDKDRAVQGIGVYAEFARPRQTVQIVIVPDGFDNDGHQVSASVIRRQITDVTPKKQWKFANLPAIGATTIPTDEILNYSEGRLRYSSGLFDQLVAGGWTLVQKPILVEVSRKDYDSIRARKTPTKLLYRVYQSRKALGFPEDLIQTATV